MKESGGGDGGFVRADQIDLKSLDEQLERHLTRRISLDNKRASADEGSQRNRSPLKVKHDWEIDPSKLIIKSVIARGTFGTVHRGIYDGQDVAGQLLRLPNLAP